MGSNRQIKQVGEQWKHAVAGCTAGLASVLALQPLDVIKTRLQGRWQILLVWLGWMASSRWLSGFGCGGW